MIGLTFIYNKLLQFVYKYNNMYNMHNMYNIHNSLRI